MESARCERNENTELSNTRDKHILNTWYMMKSVES